LVLSQETISILKRQIIQLQHRVALLEMDPNVLKNLTFKQLSQLRELVQIRLQSLDNTLSQESPSSLVQDVQDQTCVVCLSSIASVIFDPCEHKSLCEECFIQWQEREETTCPICRTPILSSSFSIPNYVKRISIEDYQRIGISHTSQELLKLFKYLRQNPSELEKLEKCDRKLIEEYIN